jgi:acyl-CoA thioesterase-2
MAGGRPVEEQLALVEEGGDVFTRPGGDVRHVFGGMLVAQGLRAAQRSGVSRRPHSLHASFLGAADGRVPLSYEVERTRDGRSFSTRRVVARQTGALVFVLTVGFSDPEEGPTYEVPADPDVPRPDDLPVGRYATPWFDSRDVPTGDDDSSALPHVRRAWFRARVPMGDDQALHDEALAYLTDHGPTRAVREPHADHPGIEARMSVSLDHAVWLAGPARADRWLLSELVPVATGGGRGLALGTVRTEDGTLVATVAQETLLRLPDA